MAVLTTALDGSKGTGLSPLAITGPVAVGVVALVLYLLHARNNNRALFSLKLFRTRTFRWAGGELCRTYWQWYVALYDAGFPANWPWLLTVSCRTDDDPDGAWQHGDEADCCTGGESLWLSSGTDSDHAGSVAGHPVVYDYRSVGLVLRFAVRPVLQGMVNSTRFSSMNTLTLKDLPDNLASSGNSLLSMIMQLSMSIGVTIAGLLLGLLVRSMSASTAAPHKPSLCTPA